MIASLIRWVDDRTGIRGLIHEALFERVPGGARWRYVWGSTLVFAFVVQAITGVCLWMCYSPSSQTAWESVYYVQHEMQGGWLLRGVHHFMAQAMVVLLGIHLLQVVIDGAYRAPREFNFWLGLVLMQITLGLSLTGYLLPWDQKGYWATQVATNIAGIVPFVGDQLQKFVVGGSEYGHHTLTRFFAQVRGSYELVMRAAGVLVFPSIVKAGMGIGGEYGEGALRIGGRTVAYYNSISASVGLGLLFRRSTAAITMPGVQKPHWSAWASRKAAWTGWRSAPLARPSMVVTLAPLA